ncbi:MULTISPECIES: site-2 protease family protein [Actibacterium]|uniref:Zinc metalloprotease n=1 Tax=Actibacterium naphthalenivorans TaxID=1614693 RepID=A0A840C838_9RHOB|nr:MULTISPECIES: site-2 protease family protein [Actibacterium]ALG90216.1 protease [Actibacterium sp. EMB200-NS6]MBB4022111.1 stage IV sporulation protein FB [Actibacterium naphthalenivorans]
MTWSFPIGRLFGTELRVHATFFLLLLWIGAAAYMVGGTPAAVENILFVIALFACVVAHEFGHALTARRYGIKTPDVTLLPIGGMARLERMPEKPLQEITVALAGPAVNIVIYLVLALIFGVETRLEALAAIENPAQSFLGRLAAVNLFLALFNLLPAFPMDGGRVFRAVLALFMDRVQATRIAATAGQFLAFALGFLGLTSGNPVLLLIAIFVFMAAAAESSDVALRDMAKNLLAREAMITAFESLRPDDGIQAASAALIRTTQHEFPVLDSDGTLKGFVTRNAIFQAAAGDQPPRKMADIVTTGIPSVALTARLDKALDGLSQGNAPAVAVTDQAGRMIGYITRENIGELMVISGRKR